MKKLPKRYKCNTSKRKTDKPKTKWVQSFGFATCPNCGGPLKEREEWLEAYREEHRKVWGF